MLEKPDYLKIGKATLNCAVCGKSLVESDRLASVLMPSDPNDDTPQPTEPSAPTKHEEEDPGFLRRDYCTDCWNDLKERAFFSFWIGHRAPTNLPPRRLTKAERNVALAALFDSFSDRPDDETDYTPHLFFLAHLLMKFKVFKWLPSAPHPETGETMLHFLRAQTGEEIFIRDIDMPDETVAKIKDDIEAYLKQATGQVMEI